MNKTEDELTKGEKSQQQVIGEYNNLTSSLGVNAPYVSCNRKYSLVAETVNFSVSYVEQTIQKYLRGEIKFFKYS